MEQKKFIFFKVFLLIFVTTISSTDHDDHMKWLISEGLPLSPESIIRIQVSEADRESLISQAMNNFRSRPEILKFSHIVFSHFNPSHGRIKETSDGGFVWTIAIKSKDAASLRIHLSEFNLPEDCQLYVYNKYCQVPGPYINQGPDNKGEFWTETLFGDTLYIQLRSYKPIFDKSLNSLGFRINKIAHLGNQIAKVKFPDGGVVKFLEIFPGCISYIEHDGISDNFYLTKDDVQNLTPIEVYKKLTNSEEAPDEFYKAMERQEYMKNNFPDFKKPAYLDPFEKTENITHEPGVDKFESANQSKRIPFTNELHSTSEITGVDDSEYPRDKFKDDLFNLHPNGPRSYRTRRYGNYTWYVANDIFFATVLAGSFDGKFTVKVYRRTWSSWNHIDTDTVREGRKNRRKTRVYCKTWWNIPLDYDLKVVITNASGNGWHCGVGKN